MAYRQQHRATVALEEEGSAMGEKSKGGGSNAKTAASKTLKEKRTAKADKKASNERSQNTDAVTRVKNK